MTIAFLFPGQGSQFVGMGRDWIEQFPEARALLAEADSILGFPLSALMFQGPESVLTDTVNAQPALLVHSIAVLRALCAARPELKAAIVAGHSMGEYSALVAAGAIEFGDALRLVRVRGESMKAAGEQHPGAMAAILGLDDQALEAICRDVGQVQVANYNSPGQTVISGEKEALDRALALAKGRGARRAVPLAVSIAAHSALMIPAAERLGPAVRNTPFRVPAIPVISNITAAPLAGVEEIREELVAQLTSPVQWVRSIQYMAAQGVSEFLEIGPKDVLAGLVRRILPNPSVTALGTPDALNGFLETH